MKKLQTLFRVLALVLIANVGFAQTVDCFIIDNPATNQFYVYVVAKGGSFETQQWNDMVIAFSIPVANPNNLGINANGNAGNVALPTNTLAGGNTFQQQNCRPRKQPTNVGWTPTFTKPTRKYYAYAFAGNTDNLTTNWDGEAIPQGFYLPENVPVLVAIIPDNGNAFSDIQIHGRTGVDLNPELVGTNMYFYIEMDNLERSGNVYKEDIIHFSNRMNEVPTGTEPLVWRGGTDATREPDLTDASRTLTVYNGPAVKTMIGRVATTNFLTETNIVVMPDAGFQTTSFGTITGADSIIVKADITGYGQYIGPSIPGSIEQYVGTNSGWRNVCFPIASSNQNANRLNFGGAPINFNTSSTSYHASPATRDVCGVFGAWDNQVNVYTFRGATGSPRPHEWYGASAAALGGTTGYSIFLDNGFFATTGIISVDGMFNAGPLDYSYSHSTPHALNQNGASQALYTGVGGCPDNPEIPADRKANWDGWALVANPYACGLDVTLFCATNGIAPSNVRVWNRANPDTILGNGGIDYRYQSMAGKIIPPMQAFYVKVGTNGSSQSISFLDAHRAFSSESFLKSSSKEIELIAVNMIDSAANHTILAFDPMATNSYDVAYDSYVLSQPGNTTPQIGFHNQYVTNGTTVVAPLYVSTVNEPSQSASYPLRFWSRSAGNFSFSLDQSKLDPTWTVYLEDTKTAPGVSHNITNQSYNFSYVLTDSPTRFILHYVNAAFGVDENSATAWNATGWFNNSNQLVIGLNGTSLPNTAKVTIYDVAGKQLYTNAAADTNSEIVIDNNFTAGVYMITLEGSNGETRFIKVVKSK